MSDEELQEQGEPEALDETQEIQAEEQEVSDEIEDRGPDWSAEELEKAKAYGYKIDDEKGLSPGEFNRNGSFIKKIEKQNKAIQSLTQKVHQLKSEMTAAQRKGYEEGLRALEVQRREAVKYGDEEAFERLDTQVSEIKAQMASVNVPMLTPAQEEFQSRHHDWINGDTAKGKVIFDKVKEFVECLSPSLSPEERMQQVDEYVELSFPNRASPVPKKTTHESKVKPVSTVVGSHSPSMKSSPGKYSLSDLDAYQKDSYNRIRANNPKFTVDDYVSLLQRGSK